MVMLGDTVYVLTHTYYGQGHHVVGVYNSLEDAQAYAKKSDGDELKEWVEDADEENAVRAKGGSDHYWVVTSYAIGVPVL